eukprot:scaffold23791_cov109-Isochrysis_galbana.AAC.5
MCSHLSVSRCSTSSRAIPVIASASRSWSMQRDATKGSSHAPAAPLSPGAASAWLPWNRIPVVGPNDNIPGVWGGLGSGGPPP